MKRLLLCALLIANHTYACVDKTIAISNCYQFFENTDQVVSAFEKAAKKAKIPGFSLQKMDCGDGLIHYYYFNDYGCITLSIDTSNSNCMVDFYCSNDSFNYKKFFGSFLKSCYAKERPHIPTVNIKNEASSGPYNPLSDLGDKMDDEDYFDSLVNGDSTLLELY
jgi:hypothetical protein